MKTIEVSEALAAYAVMAVGEVLELEGDIAGHPKFHEMIEVIQSTISSGAVVINQDKVIVKVTP